MARARFSKIEIEMASRLLPVHRFSLHFLCCIWEGGYYVCILRCLVSFWRWWFGLPFGDLLFRWLFCIALGQARVYSVLLYSVVRTIERVAADFEVMLVQEKTEDPLTAISFFWVCYWHRIKWRLPSDKLEGLKVKVTMAQQLQKIQLRDLQSLIGKLNFTCCIMPMKRVFSRQLAATTTGVSAPHHYAQFGRELLGDLLVWTSFVEQFNGRDL